MIRSFLKEAFFDIFGRVEHPEAVKRILDAGCGLGYLCELAAKFFSSASVTGVDLFGSQSLPEGDLVLAEQNMKVAGVGDRVKFVKSDIADLNFPEEHFDLVVSNLVFHNLGKKRFNAYSHIAKALKPNGFFVVGDFSKTGDKKFLQKHFTLLAEKAEVDKMPHDYSIILYRKK